MKKLSNRTKKNLYTIAIVILLLIFLCSAGVLIWYGIESKKAADAYDDLAAMVDAARPSVMRPTAPRETAPAVTEETDPAASTTQPAGTEHAQTEPAGTEPVSELVAVTDPETGEEVQLLPEFVQLYQINNDLIGWLEIEGTDISYPVMQSETEDYYLRRNFYREYASAGCLYVEEAADVFRPSDNVTIYGHRMSDGSMFFQLGKYLKEEFYQEHPYIYFDTLTERHVYQIAYVFRTTATVGEGFAYHYFVDAYHEYHFYEFRDACRSLSFYDTGVKVLYGDKLITLSTCEYSQPNGRLVIVAKRIS